MKKLLLLIPILILSCKESTAKPLDLYKNKGIVVVRNPRGEYPNDARIGCKNKDSVFYILVPYFDAEHLKPGDTIK